MSNFIGVEALTSSEKDKVTKLDLIQDFTKTREVREFLSGALAGAMTKAILAPLETIRLVSTSFFIYEYWLGHI